MGKFIQDHNLLFGFRQTITDEQEDLINLILAPTSEVQYIFVEAEAGTGKTQMAVIGAKLRGKKLRYIFAPVNEDEQGYLPGDTQEKDEPYLAPLKQALVKIGEKPEQSIFNKKEFHPHAWVYAHSHSYERGSNYEDETVIVEEAQNFTKHQLRKVLTRPHDNSKTIIIGNIKQCDLPNPADSGFEEYMIHGIGIAWIRKVQLTENFRGRGAKWADSIK